MTKLTSSSKSLDIVILVIGLLSAIFFFVGSIGSYAFVPRLFEYWDAAQWDSAPAHVLSADIQQYRSRGTTSRPKVRFEYEYRGQRYQSTDYDLLDVYTSDFTWANGVVEDLRRNPNRPALVNPRNPARAVLARGRAVETILLFVPPFFVLLSLAGGSLTFVRWRWLALGQPRQGAIGRFVHAWTRFFSNETALRAIFFTGFFGFMILIAAIGWYTENWLVAAVVLFMVFGLWRAMQKR